MKPERCKNGQHHDRRKRRGKHYECTTCRDVFPCRGGACDHLDCIVATDRELPEHIDPAAREAIAAELALLYPDHRFACGMPAYVVAVLEAASSAITEGPDL